MRFSSHEPGKEAAAGLVLLAGAVLVAAGVAYGVSTARFPGRALIPALTASFLSLGLVLAGITKLKDAAALRRERRLLGPRRPLEARVKLRPRAPAADPDRAPAFPTRRMIAVTVLFASLIAPALYGAFFFLRWGISGVGMSLFSFATASCLTFIVVALWKPEDWAWKAAVGIFLFGFVGSVIPLAIVCLEWEPRAAFWAGAGTSHFGVGLVALFSLRPWLRYLEWKPGRDLLATADKAAVLAALRSRKRV